MIVERAPLDRVEADEAGRSLRSYFDSFAPAPAWNDLVDWPPDVFAVANLVLDHTESYRFVVAPPRGRRWPPFPGWSEQVRAEARKWRETCLCPDARVPPLVRRSWAAVTRGRDVPLAKLRSGEAWELVAALLTLHALADEACAEVSSPSSPFAARAGELLRVRGSLSRVSPLRVRIVPKTNFSPRGITIRSLSRHLALCYEAVDVRWRGGNAAAPSERGDYEIVLLPWPLSVHAHDFRPSRPAALENMDLDRFGFFEFAPDDPLDLGLVGALLDEAQEQAGRVDAVVLPEASVEPGALAGLERTLAQRGATFLIAGVREQPRRSRNGRNYLHFGVLGETGWSRFEQDKHHRWCLDDGQIRQYHLTRSLDPRKLWWEAIDVRERTLHVVDVGGRITTAPLVCEDLASLDEVADLVRRMGPSLVVAVLLDGPQLAARWPCRYASVLADDPGSAVLTLTSYGMAARCRPPGRRRSRVIAHWNSPADGLHELALAPRAQGVLLSARVEAATAWTADGRRHEDVPRLALAQVRQLHARSRA
ncbi:MAG TPA: hypothetical protein VLD16_08305 [Gaiellaceae bacterium]|nr:hypothetical protein [Gaiellaceae bacterium]